MCIAFLEANWLFPQIYVSFRGQMHAEFSVDIFALP